MAFRYKKDISEVPGELQKISGFVCEICKSTYQREAAIKKDMSCCNRTLKELGQESFSP